jgi:hypothetical protein
MTDDKDWYIVRGFSYLLLGLALYPLIFVAQRLWTLIFPPAQGDKMDEGYHKYRPDNWDEMTEEEQQEWKQWGGKRPITWDEHGNATIWWYLLALPCICLLCVFHFTLCSILTILVHPPRKRYRFYEYYARWGWGDRPGFDEWGEEGCPYPGGKKPS